MSEQIHLLLVDDHVMLRQGTAELLQREPDLKVIGEAGNGREAIEMAEAWRPDIVVMDVHMPVLSGVEATRRIRTTLPQVQVLVLTAHNDMQYVFALLEAGASGYLLKTAPIHELVKAIRLVRAGESPLDPAIARKVVAQRKGENALAEYAAANPGLEDLTPRELEVLQMLAHGLNNRAIAEEMYVSDRTVQAHLTSIFAKMHVSSRLEAVLAGIRHGWLTLGP